MDYYTTRKLRFGCGAALNSRLNRTQQITREKLKHESSVKSEKDSLGVTKTLSAGNKQE